MRQFEVTSFKGVRDHAVLHMWSIQALIQAVFLSLHSAHNGPGRACHLCQFLPVLCRLFIVPVLDDVVVGGRGNRSRARRARKTGVYYILLHVCSDITACSKRHLQKDHHTTQTCTDHRQTCARWGRLTPLISSARDTLAYSGQRATTALRYLAVQISPEEENVQFFGT